MSKYPTRKSKSEARLFKYLQKKLPQLRVVPSDTKVCHGFELDISFPQLKLAIEWNGIFHREPIYGYVKLNHIRKNDKIKRQILATKGWSIITVEDIDSKNPILYSKLALDMIMKIIEKEEYKNDKSISITIESGMIKTG